MYTDCTVAAPSVDLAVRDYGGDGRALVLIHGLASNVCIWDAVGPMLAERFRVVAYDQRSHGLSSAGDGDFGFDALVRDLRAVVDALRLERPVVVGHSWGAAVALHYAAGDPECPGVICVDGGLVDMQALGTSWEDVEGHMRPPRLEGSKEEVLATIKEHSPGVSWERLEPIEIRGFVVDRHGVFRPRLPFDDHMRIARFLWEQRVTELYERINCPVLAVVARDEQEDQWLRAKTTCLERVLEAKPDTRVEWLNSVHDVPIVRPTELVALIEDFVSTR